MRIINPRSEQLLDVGGHWAFVWDGQLPSCSFLCFGWSGGEEGDRVRFEEVIDLMLRLIWMYFSFWSTKVHQSYANMLPEAIEAASHR
ncbi:hypothetical protein NPIL_388221 [Nephila pilipes]|uniref:Uncharacterized protein n=1 Tax=Nephila pilipes TaxID=299642 RepID=A0A8X6Q9Q7_NEPPI|nr:hypothetical protein NPIL_388221 [Nephila pilipes]